jgi:uncharacterized protein involved in exopolysaccharide biosynthesis
MDTKNTIKSNDKQTSSSHEIDFINVTKQVFKDWKTLLIFVGVAFILGCIIAFNTPKTYTADVILAPELNSSNLGINSNLADMASNLGIDIGDKKTADAIYPDIYPDIFESPDFILGLFNVQVTTTEGSTKTYKEHLLRDTKSPFWTYPQAWLAQTLKKKNNKKAGGNARGNNPFLISQNDADLCGAIKNMIACQIDNKTSVITISATDQDPMVAAIIADTLQKRLQTYITEYRTKKAKNDYLYFKRLNEESKSRYLKAQRAYAGFADANMDPDLASISTQRDQLENEMQLRYNIYTQTLAQLQQALAKIQERTPAFSIIQHSRMPYKPSSRSRLSIIMIIVILGFIIDFVWHVLKTDNQHH